MNHKDLLVTGMCLHLSVYMDLVDKSNKNWKIGRKMVDNLVRKTEDRKLRREIRDLFDVEDSDRSELSERFHQESMKLDWNETYEPEDALSDYRKVFMSFNKKFEVGEEEAVKKVFDLLDDLNKDSEMGI